MLIQFLGIADWSQFLTTHFQSDVVTYSSPFFDETTDFDASQRRPAGLLYSNQYLSIIALFGLAIHFSRKRGRFATGTFVMSAMTVLAMAKIVFLGFILMGLLVMISGTSYQRRAILRGFALTISLISLYAVLFPGMFKNNLNIGQMIYSVSTRIGNILHEYSPDNTALMMLQDIQQESQSTLVKLPEWEERISGYVDLLKFLPYLVTLTLTIIPFYLWGFLKSRALFPDLTTMTMMSMIIVLIIPSVGPLWFNPIYLFIGGFALFPLFVLFQQRHFKTH
jgi:hypothetical protein